MELQSLRKLLNSIDKNRPDFVKNPASFLLPLAEQTAKLNPTLSGMAKRAAEKAEPTLAELDSIIHEFAIFLANAVQGESSHLLLNTPAAKLKGIGGKKEETLKKMGILTVEDVLLHFPFRYEAIGYEGGEKGVLAGKLETHGPAFTRGRKRMYKAVFRSEHGFFSAIWFNYSGSYPASALVTGDTYRLYGNLGRFDGSPSIVHPEFIGEADIGKIRPVYSLPMNVGQRIFASAVAQAAGGYLDYMPDTLPLRFADKYSYPDIKSSVKTLHFPDDINLIPKLTSREHPSYERFVYEELFYLQLGLLMKKKLYEEVSGMAYDIKPEFLDEIAAMMPFKLTSAQKKVLADIFNDMKVPRQMNRLVQGDVGSGKTIVCFVAALIAVKNGCQAAVIAPTEVLAEQHFRSLQNFLSGTRYTCAILTGSVSDKDKKASKELIRDGVVDFVVGTHAIIQEDTQFKSLGFVVIDEQHRFGVLQRKTLVDKGYTPDILLMSATPIPRTLSLTFYGDLDISVIDAMPPGRKPVITKSFPESSRRRIFESVKRETEAGHRAYFVYPLIEASDKSDMKAATDGYKEISAYFREENTGLLHGRMKAEEKRSLMDAFKAGRISVLVSTTVIEVGVDVPEATVMVIENAERFGLSQLHQLRGRVGRGDAQSYCILVHSGDISEDGQTRIQAMVKHSDGFKLSEIDLEIRGPGDFFGTRQSGLPQFRFSNIVKDVKILQRARKDAEEILADDPVLAKPVNKIVLQTLKTRWKEGIDFLNIG
jgi:ATP-dependent DNA helicase RecG